MVDNNRDVLVVPSVRQLVYADVFEILEELGVSAPRAGNGSHVACGATGEPCCGTGANRTCDTGLTCTPAFNAGVVTFTCGG
jgi:hypothetical protein